MMEGKRRAGRGTSREKAPVAARPIDVTSEVQVEFAEASRFRSNEKRFQRQLDEHHSRTPDLSGGDLDADWARADIGEETVGGTVPTPDQSIVEELGEAMGVTYKDNEPLHPADKIRARDQNRWELNPASSEDYLKRGKKKEA